VTSYANMSTRNCTWMGLGLIPSLRGENVLRNRLRYSMFDRSRRKGDHGVSRLRMCGAIRHVSL